MGPISLYLGLAAAVTAAQVPPQEGAQAPSIKFEAVPIDLPVVYRLPQKSAPGPQRLAGGRDPAWVRITPPPQPQDPFQLPSAEVWRGSSAVRTNPVGVKFGWAL